MVQRLLSSAEFKMDPLVSLYYFAPACAVINLVFTIFFELPKMSMTNIYDLGLITLLLNAFVAFGLNVSVVLLVSNPSFCRLPLQTNCVIDWQNLRRRSDPLRSAERHPPRHGLNGYLRRSSRASAILWLFDCPRWTGLLQARRREDAADAHASQTHRGQPTTRAPWQGPSSCDSWLSPVHHHRRTHLVPGAVAFCEMSVSLSTKRWYVGYG